MTGLDNELKNIRLMSSDREEAVEKGMSPYLILATWLACKRHVEDDCRIKLSSLDISPAQSNYFLLDVFGSDVKKEKGIIDSESCEDLI